MRLRILSLTFLLAAAPPLAAWGHRGHEIVAALACRDLPPDLAAWFQGREQTVVDHANDPDAWKFHDPQEGPRHFLDSEAYGGPDGVPEDRAAAQAKLGAEAFATAGQAPWVVQDRVADLAQAFQAGDPDAVAFQAAILCHYVGDLNVPLHTTENYNGQFTGQLGVHSRWETGLVERLGAWNPAPRPANPRRADPQAPFAWLRQSYALVATLLADDRASQGTELAPWEVQNSRYWTQFNQLQGPRVRRQLERAGQRTAEMILLAWNQAGQPRP